MFLIRSARFWAGSLLLCCGIYRFRSQIWSQTSVTSFVFHFQVSPGRSQIHSIFPLNSCRRLWGFGIVCQIGPTTASWLFSFCSGFPSKWICPCFSTSDVEKSLVPGILDSATQKTYYGLSCTHLAINIYFLLLFLDFHSNLPTKRPWKSHSPGDIWSLHGHFPIW